MYLTKVQIKYFRCIRNLTLDYSEHVNVIVGENNTGKSAIIDALRLAFSWGDYTRSIWVQPEDFYIDINNPKPTKEDIQIDLFFKPETRQDLYQFRDLAVISEEEDKNHLQLHFNYHLEERDGITKIKPRVWGGEKEGQPVSSDILELLYAIHLGALRDAEDKLRPKRGSHIGGLLSSLKSDPVEQKKLANKIRENLAKDEDWKSLLALGSSKVSTHLRETSLDSALKKIHIDFLPFSFKRLVESLILKIPLHQNDLTSSPESEEFFELYQNGLGYNNLIYAAVVLGDLERRKEIEAATYAALFELPKVS